MENPIKVGFKFSADNGFFFQNPVKFEVIPNPNTNLYFVGFYNSTLNQTNTSLNFIQNGFEINLTISYFGKPYAGLKTTIEEASLSMNRIRIGNTSAPMDLLIFIPIKTPIYITKYGNSYETIKGNFTCYAHHFDQTLTNITNHYANIIVEYSVIRLS